MKFSELNIDSHLLKNIQDKNYEIATPIQEKAIPAVLDSKDLIAKAETGSGKTMAFLIPVIEKIIKLKAENPKSRDTHALILAPTRELAKQILDETRTIISGINISTISVYGGARINGQIMKLKRGVDLVIGCPGRVLDLSKRNALNLNALHVLVLDEADQMLDMGFFGDIKKIVAKTSAKRQTIMFSATMPKEIKEFANQILNEPIELSVGEERPKASIEHSFYETMGKHKNDILLSLLKEIESKSVIVFARTKGRAQDLNDFLADSGINSTVLEGGMSPNARRDAWEAFKAKEVQVLVATDIASRGLDVRSISHVINYDMPNSVESYTHRIGRTGRYDEKGFALTLVGREDNKMVHMIGRKLQNDLIWKNISPDIKSSGSDRGRASNNRSRANSSQRNDSSRDSTSRDSGQRNFRNSRNDDRRSNSGRSDRGERTQSDSRNSESRFRNDRDARPMRDAPQGMERNIERSSDRNSDRNDRPQAPRNNSESRFRDNRDSRPAREGSQERAPRSENTSNRSSRPQSSGAPKKSFNNRFSKFNDSRNERSSQPSRAR